MDREIKYVLTGDASKLKSELAAVQKQAEDAGKRMDAALTKAFKESTDKATAQIQRNMETIKKAMPKGTDFNPTEKGFNNAFNTRNLANFVKEQSNIATSLQRMDGQYASLQKNANDYAKTLRQSGVDAATAGALTTQWVNSQRTALESAARGAGESLGGNFGGLANLAPNIVAGLKQVDDNAAKAAAELEAAEKATDNLWNKLRGVAGKAAIGDISNGSKAVLKFGAAINSAARDVARMGFGIAAAIAAFSTIPLLKTISSIESAQLGLESLLSSAEEAGAAIFRIYSYANQTAFPTADLIAYEQKLVSVGLSADQAFGVITRVSDIGGAFGASSDQLDRFYYVLSQIFGAGRAMGTDFLQIQNSMPGFISAIGQAMGKSAGEVRAAFGDGNVTSQVVADALNLLTEEGGKAFQGAVRQSSTLSGMMNNLVDNLKRVGLALFGVKIGVKGLDPAVDGLYMKIKNLASTVLAFVENPVVIEVFHLVGQQISNLVGLFERFPQVIAIASGLFLAFASDLITRIPFIGNLIGGITYQTGLVLGLFVALITSSKQMQNALITMFGQIVQFVSANSGLFASLLANFQLLLNTLGQGVAPALIILTQLFLNFVQAVLYATNFLLGLANTIAQFLGPELTKLTVITFAFLSVALMIAPVIVRVIALFAALQAALASTAMKISIIIALIVALISIFSGLFSKKPEVNMLDTIDGVFNSIAGSSAEASSGIDTTTNSLKSAGKAAKAAAKQLAAFDKMNVINSPTSAAEDAGGGVSPGDIGGLTPPQIKMPDLSGLKKKLDDAFKGINDSIPEIHWWDLLIPAGAIAVITLLMKLPLAKWFGDFFAIFKHAPKPTVIKHVGKLIGTTSTLSAAAPAASTGSKFASFGKGLMSFFKYVAIGAGVAALVGVALIILAKSFQEISDASIDLAKIGLLLVATGIVSAIFAIIGIPAVAALVAVGGATAALIGVALMSLAKGLTEASEAGSKINLIDLTNFSLALGEVSAIFALLSPLAVFAAGAAIAAGAIGAGIYASSLTLSAAVPYIAIVAKNKQSFFDFSEVIAEVSVIMAAIAGLAIFAAVASVATAVISGGLTLSALLLAIAVPYMVTVVANKEVITTFSEVLGTISEILSKIVGFSVIGAVSAVANDVIALGLLAAAKLLAAAIPEMQKVNDNKKVLEDFIGVLETTSKILSDIVGFAVFGAISSVASAVLGTGLMLAATGLLKAAAVAITIIPGGLTKLRDNVDMAAKIFAIVNPFNLFAGTINSVVSSVLGSAMNSIASNLLNASKVGSGIVIKTFYTIEEALRVVRNMDLGSFFGALGQSLTGGAVTNSLKALNEIAQKLRDMPKVGQDVINNLNGIQNAMRTKWYGIGADVAVGFSEGINANLGKITWAVKNMWNSTVRSVLNGKTITASINGAKATMGSIQVPWLAKGGVISDPTLAMIGEAGREVVMPLENNTGWIDELAGKLNGSGNSNQPTVVNVYLDGNKVGGAISQSINNRSMVSGMNQIYV